MWRKDIMEGILAKGSMNFFFLCWRIWKRALVVGTWNLSFDILCVFA